MTYTEKQIGTYCATENLGGRDPHFSVVLVEGPAAAQHMCSAWTKEDADRIVAALQFHADFTTIQNAKHDTYLNFEIDGACGGLMFAADTIQESLHLAAEWIRKLEREEAT